MTTALVMGVGPGLGTALAKRFASGGLSVAVAARNSQRLEALLPELREQGAPAAEAFACDVANEVFVRETLREVIEALGVPRLVVFNAGTFVPKGLLETTPEEFENCWRTGCLGGFLVAQNAVRAMLEEAEPAADGTRGTLLFTGATASLRGGAGFHNLAVGKFGLRALSQSLAREFGSQGIHVGHVIIDGQIQAQSTDSRHLTPAAIAEQYWQLYQQPAGAWTQELDLRPYNESF
ncbi:MAG: SDR family NAD(P)-dependent oxidoreductase [Gammaproteobacteria bacterium]|nr:SDR family NAD(P)-dependent oxidoreductase [Gammaproteobacteria bacterium]